MSYPDNCHLGEISERYEGHGPGTISTGRHDHGGASYGTYQLSTALGTLDEYLKQSAYKDDFKNVTPNTKAFNDEWRTLARTKPGFAHDQQNFIKKTHYDKQLSRLKADGLDLSDRGHTVQEAIWSTSVQYGNLTTRVFEHGIADKFGKDYKLSELTDKDIVVAVQDYKITHIETDFASSPQLWGKLRTRAQNEKADLVALADGKPLPEHSHGHTHAHGNLLQLGAHGEAVTALQVDLAKLGYIGSHGQALQADGDFGKDTLHAVQAFQRDHGLAIDGKVGPRTHHAIQAETYATNEETAVFGERPAPLRAFNDSDHPQYPLYAKLEGLFPPGTSEARLTQATAACYMAGMNKPEDLGNIYGNENTILFSTNSLFANMAEMDVSKAAPTVQQSLQQVQQFDQQQQMQVQHTMEQQPVQGPIMQR